ncbi:MAG: TraB/GumN family protein [Saprospiraceae bacterium]|nr:TraB/GumN family protein [Saprospiraceae bacterium]
MNKYFSLFILFLFVTAANGQQKIENALLWKIEDPKNKEIKSYLFGTIHLIGKNDFILRDEVKTALDNCKSTIFELNMDDMNDMSKMMGIMMKANMNGDSTLKDLISKEDYNLVNDFFSKEGIPLVMFEKMKPMFISSLIMGPMSGNEKEEMVSYEMELLKIAKEKQKKIDGLETFEYQLGIFDIIPYSLQAKLLVEAVKSSKDTTSDNQLVDMIAAYKNQDLQKLQVLMNSDTKELGDYTKLLLDDRNKNWVPIIKTKIAEPTFFAVGAGHLAGENGVISLLRKAGLKVTPVIKI